GLEAVDASGGGGGAEAVVDVHHHDAGGTAVEHGEERRQTAEARTVANARGYSDDGALDEAPHHARERAFHAGDHHQDRGFPYPLAPPPPPADARQAHIGRTLG